jgi:hypothetical protein
MPWRIGGWIGNTCWDGWYCRCTATSDAAIPNVTQHAMSLPSNDVGLTPRRSPMATQSAENTTTRHVAIARAAYQAYVTKDRAALEGLLRRLSFYEPSRQSAGS